MLHGPPSAARPRTARATRSHVRSLDASRLSSRSLLARKKRNTLKKKGMTSHARWWHTARAARSVVDGVRIIVALAAVRAGQGGRERGVCALCHRER